MRRAGLADPRALAILAALTATGAALTNPGLDRALARYDLTVVVDVTMSMMVRDMAVDGRPAARLEAAKRTLTDLVGRLGCGSRVGLAIFSERRPFLLFEPVEVCENFPAIEGAIRGLDWRMAWEGDSHVASGLYKSVDLARSLKTDLVFLSDGHEAPPYKASVSSGFDGERGAVRGLVVGVGGTELSPIPKYDPMGREVGFLTVDDVPHDNRHGLPPTDSVIREGFHPRNAPFGGEAAPGEEHLSSVKEEHLVAIAEVAGLSYRRLGAGDLVQAVAESARAATAPRRVDLRPFLALAALAALALVYLALPLAGRFRRAAAVPVQRSES